MVSIILKLYVSVYLIVPVDDDGILLTVSTRNNCWTSGGGGGGYYIKMWSSNAIFLFYTTQGFIFIQTASMDSVSRAYY